MTASLPTCRSSECIAKGKARTRYEFGVKTSIAVTNARTAGGQFIVGMQALPGNPYDGHTLSGQIEQVERLTGVTAEGCAHAALSDVENHTLFHHECSGGACRQMTATSPKVGSTSSHGAMTARAGLMYLMYQLDAGVCCPGTMTFAAVPALRRSDRPLRPNAHVRGVQAGRLLRLPRRVQHRAG